MSEAPEPKLKSISIRLKRLTALEIETLQKPVVEEQSVSANTRKRKPPTVLNGLIPKKKQAQQTGVFMCCDCYMLR